MGYTHTLSERALARKNVGESRILPGELSLCVLSTMNMCMSLVSSIRLSGRGLDVASSNSLRSLLSFRFGDSVL